MVKNSNFLNSYKLAYKDRTILLKNSIIGILIVACFALGSLFFVGLLQDFTNANLIGFCVFWIIGLGMLPIFFLVLPIKDFLVWNLIISASAFIPLLLSHQLSKIIWFVWGVIFILFLLSRIRIKTEYNSLINLQWIRIVGKGSFFILLSLAISLSALACFHGNMASIEQGGIKTLDSIFSQTGAIQPYSNLQLSGTVDDILGKYIQQQTPDLGVFDSISKLSEFLHYPVTGKEKLSSLIVEVLKSRWQTFSSLLKIGVSVLVFLLMISFLKFFNIIFSIILVAISWIFLQILLYFKYLKIKRIGVEKQEIIIA